MPSRLFDDGVSVDVGEQAEAKPLRVGWVCESVDCYAGLAGMEGFSDARVQLVVTDAAPEGGLAVHDRLSVNGWARRQSGERHVVIVVDGVPVLRHVAGWGRLCWRGHAVWRFKGCRWTVGA